MTYLKLDLSGATPFLGNYNLSFFKQSVESMHQLFHGKSSVYEEHVGWVELPGAIGQEELAHITRCAERIQEMSDIVLIIGIGGSYLGARAAMDMLNHSFYNLLASAEKGQPQLIFAGHNLSSTYISHVMDLLQGKDFSIIVISKSGTTMEPAIAFRIFRSILEERYGKAEAGKRIFATTDQSRGALRQLIEKEGYESFVIPGDIGGRYSVLSPVGLLPMAVGSIDIHKILEGARQAQTELADPALERNPAYQYAVVRNILFQKGLSIEMLVSYEPGMRYLAEWWKQLFGESEGKNQRGIFPASSIFSTDLHSFGQYIQEGQRNVFETIIQVDRPLREVLIPMDDQNIDGLNYLTGRSVDFVNRKACEGAFRAHGEGGVPIIGLEIPAMDAFSFGYLVYFFQKACALSACLFGVNPFDQPGVENYKIELFKLLEKPGYLLAESAKGVD